MKKMLIVDDEEIIRELLKEIIEAIYPVEIDIAEEGKIALEMSSKSQYDLVLTDINMPNGMNGDEFIKELLSSGYSKPICVMSGYNANEVIQQNPQIQKFFKKPVQAEQILEGIKEYLEK